MSAQRVDARFLMALWDHYGDLPFSAVALANKPRLRDLAPVPESQLDAWFAERAGSDQGAIVVVPVIGYREGSSRNLWRLISTVEEEGASEAPGGHTGARSRATDGVGGPTGRVGSESVTSGPVCAVCRRPLVGRAHARTCSARCRKALQRTSGSVR